MARSKDRARAALDAVKALGFSRKVALPVLRRLLTLYDNKWELIEDENYQTLVDAILESQENPGNNTAESAAGTEECDQILDAPEHNLERFESNTMERFESNSLKRKSPQDNWTSSSKDEVFLKKPKPESDILPDEVQHKELPLSLPQGRKVGGNSSSDLRAEQEGIAPASQLTRSDSPEMSQRLTRSSTRALHLVEHDQTSTLTLYRQAIEARKVAARGKSSEEHGIGRAGTSLPGVGPQKWISSAVSIANVIDHRRKGIDAPLEVEPPSDETIRNLGISSDMPVMLSLTPGEQGVSEVNGNVRNELTETLEASSDMDIASSSSGRVKLCLKYESGGLNFQIPSLEQFFKMVEERCLHSVRLIQPEFSFSSLMKEVCEVFDIQNDPGSDDQCPIAADDHCISAASPSEQHNNSAVHPVGESGRNNFSSDSVASEIDPLPGSSILIPASLALGELRPIHDFNDISRGEERMRIPIINEVGSSTCPPSFYYISESLVYQNAYVNYSLARIGDEDCCSDCYGDCLSAPVPCACARQTGGEFAYTSDGLIKKEFLDDCVLISRDAGRHPLKYCKSCPLEIFKNGGSSTVCKGHKSRKFIKECWSKCGCHKHCGNRIVQRGITANLQVFLTSDERGWGLRTVHKLDRGAFVCEYIGEVLTSRELFERISQSTCNSRTILPLPLDADWGSESTLKDEEALCLDAKFYGNCGRFINHRCYDANLVDIPVEVETPDHHSYHIAFFTNRKVEAFEELTFDYGNDFKEQDQQVNPFRCHCGSRYCRDSRRRRNRGKAKAKASE